VVVLDTAPTGHALRLLEMPGTALEWVRAFLALLLKYREVIGLGDLAADLVEIARGLRQLVALLGDGTRARFVAVTRAAALPRLETARLMRALARLGIATPVLIVNAVGAVERAACARCRERAAEEQRERERMPRPPSSHGPGCAMIIAPDVAPPPRGPEALALWGRAWTLEGAATAGPERPRRADNVDS
jgi:arsenite-transporting ATPase